MKIDYKIIGSRIRESRKKNGFTQENLAEKLNVSVGYISQVERGITKISLDLLGEISGALSCDIAFFITGAAVSNDSYLMRELSVNFSYLSKSEKRLVLGFMDLLKNYNASN